MLPRHRLGVPVCHLEGHRLPLGLGPFFQSEKDVDKAPGLICIALPIIYLGWLRAFIFKPRQVSPVELLGSFTTVGSHWHA